MSLPVSQTQPAWPLLYDVMEISSKIREDYSIELLKTPNDFKNIPIANSHSIIDLLSLPDEEFDIMNKQLIYDFLGNRTLSEIEEIEIELLNEMENKNAWVEVKYKGIHSTFLTGSYLLDMPSVSFRTDNNFEVDKLPCTYSIEYSDRTKTKEVEVKNIYHTSQIKKHEPFLIKIKSDIKFGKGNWNPYHKPIWNDKTKALITEMEFPQSVEGKKDKIAELKDVGQKIALLNCWRFDNEITEINSNKGQIRMVFVSESEHKKAYLSIDMKNAYGRFEHHNDKGHHTGEIKFETGEYVPRGTAKTGKDNSGHHDLKLKK
jgi:hypothetical protein